VALISEKNEIDMGVSSEQKQICGISTSLGNDRISARRYHRRALSRLVTGIGVDQFWK
jgi:hypothetical protein